jgi:hypothetical protein
MTFGVWISWRATSVVSTSEWSQILEYSLQWKNQELSPVRMNCQFASHVCIRSCNKSIDFARRSARSFSVRTPGINLYFRENNPSRFVKILNTVANEFSSCQWSGRQKPSGPSRWHRGLIRRGVHSQAFVVSPRNCRSSQRYSRFESPTNTSLQGDKRPQQVSCGSQRLTSLARGIGGQDLPVLCKKMNCETHTGVCSSKTERIITDVKERG